MIYEALETTYLQQAARFLVSVVAEGDRGKGAFAYQEGRCT